MKQNAVRSCICENTFGKRQKNTVPKRLTEAFDKVKNPTKVIKNMRMWQNNV